MGIVNRGKQELIDHAKLIAPRYPAGDTIQVNSLDTDGIHFEIETGETVYIDIDEFDDKYEVVTDEDGTWLEVEDAERIQELKRQRRLWTQYSNEFIVNEVGAVNRVRYLETKKPCIEAKGRIIVYNEFYHMWSDEDKAWIVDES